MQKKARMIVKKCKLKKMVNKEIFWVNAVKIIPFALFYISEFSIKLLTILKGHLFEHKKKTTRNYLIDTIFNGLLFIA